MTLKKNSALLKRHQADLRSTAEIPGSVRSLALIIAVIRLRWKTGRSRMSCRGTETMPGKSASASFRAFGEIL